MGVALCYDDLGSDMQALREKAAQSASKVVVS
jgi:hypothetical protein